ncbi:MAG: hypothetical protein ABIM36_03530 [candidate division WOR-3 bacterium]
MKKILAILIILSAFLYAQREDIITYKAFPTKVALTGRAKLSNGFCEVKFPVKVSDIVPEAYDIKVLVVPYGSWSGIYITHVDEFGFKCKSETGNLNAEFDYFVICRSKRAISKYTDIKIKK